MKYFIALCVLFVVCSTQGAPDVDDYSLLVLSNGNLDRLGNTRNLIEQLAANLRKSAQVALNAVATFNAGMRDEVGKVRDKIVEDLNKFKFHVQDAVDNVMKRISNSSVAVKECVYSYRSAAAAVFNETLSTTMVCVDERILEITEKIKYLGTLGSNAMSEAADTLEDMKKCTEDHTNLFATGSCLGAVAMQTEVKSFRFISQSGITIANIDIAIASLPSTLNVCAGKSIIHAGIETSKIVVDIGTCSAQSIFSIIVGKPQNE